MRDRQIQTERKRIEKVVRAEESRKTGWEKSGENQRASGNKDSPSLSLTIGWCPELWTDWQSFGIQAVAF